MLVYRLPQKTYLVGVGAVLMFGPVGGIAEGLVTSRKLAGVRFLARVTATVGLQVLQPAVALVAALELKHETETPGQDRDASTRHIVNPKITAPPSETGYPALHLQTVYWSWHAEKLPDPEKHSSD